MACRSKLQFFLFSVLAAACTRVAFAEEEFSRPIVFPKRGSFYVSVMAPYPATYGLGITHFFGGEHFGLALGFGKGEIVTWEVGLKFRAAAAKLSPMIGLHVSRGGESNPGAVSTAGDTATPRGFLFATSGVDWKWDSGPLLHLGIQWTLTPKAGKTEMKPYVQIGFPY